MGRMPKLSIDDFRDLSGGGHKGGQGAPKRYNSPIFEF